MTLKGVSGSVPLRGGGFTVLTDTGTILTPTVTVVGGGPVPGTVAAGRTLELRLAAQLPEGDGTIRWAPVNDRNLVAWEWTLELD